MQINVPEPNGRKEVGDENNNKSAIKRVLQKKYLPQRCSARYRFHYS